MTFRTAEFFAGIGLVRAAVEQAGFEVVFANDIEANKHAMYEANFEASHFVLGDLRTLSGRQVPQVDLATASFPCTDLSLAGNRAGLAGSSSGLFWEFARVLAEMNNQRPLVVLLENVVGFATSRGGQDLAAAIQKLNELGYRCDLFTVDAKWFVPQSRPRLFIVGSQLVLPALSDQAASELRPAWVHAFVKGHPELAIQMLPMLPPEKNLGTIADCIERFAPDDSRWWDPPRLARFLGSLSPLQAERLRQLQAERKSTWATAYRRTRQGHATWEIRADALSGCLRAARGGSSRQAVVEAEGGRVRVRWMTTREYARLQGAPHFKLGSVRENKALFGFGDAVCVPVVAWIARTYLRPLLERKFTR